MSRRTFVLQEIGHSPLWLRRGHNLAADEAAPVLSGTTEQAAGSAPETTAAAPFSPATAQAPTATMAIEASAPASPGFPDTPCVPAGDWQALHKAVATCQRCALAKTRRNVVIGRGNPKARLLIIGEAPGEQEDLQGQPFVGKAGQLLENMLAAAGINSEQEVYICNVIKCRPPGNRNPAADEIAHCQDYLRWQIDTLQPQLIVALGRFAAHTLLQSQVAISSLRRQVHQAHGVPLLVTFHPAYLLRSPAEKAKAWQDWCQVRSLLASSN